MADLQLVSMCSMAALAGLCANPHHQAGEHPNTGSDAVTDRALVLGKALAAKIQAERDAEHARLEADRAKLEAERDALRAKLAAAPPAESEPKIDDAPDPKKKR